MSKKRRRHFTPEEKSAILRRHLADKVSVADLCDEYKIQPSLFYQWQRQLLDNAARALEPKGRPDRRESRLEAKVDALESKLRRKDRVIAEISEEFVKGKRSANPTPVDTPPPSEPRGGFRTKSASRSAYSQPPRPRATAPATGLRAFPAGG